MIRAVNEDAKFNDRRTPNCVCQLLRNKFVYVICVGRICVVLVDKCTQAEYRFHAKEVIIALNACHSDGEVEMS